MRYLLIRKRPLKERTAVAFLIALCVVGILNKVVPDQLWANEIAGGEILAPLPYESGVAFGVTNTEWMTVPLRAGPYSSIVVIATPIYSTGDPPQIVRIRHTTGNNFQMRIQRFDGDGSAINGTDVNYIVIEEGAYSEAVHGITMEAVRYTSTTTDGAGNWNGESRAFQNTYINPVVVGQVMSHNDTRPSVFWSRGATPASPPASDAFFTGKHVGEDPDAVRSTETIGYIVVEAGATTFDNISFIAGLGPATVRGINLGASSYPVTGLTETNQAVLGLAGTADDDGGWAVLHGPDAVTTSAINLVIDEEQIADGEREHSAERVAYFVVVDTDNASPVANSDIYELERDATLNVAASTGLLANDFDPDNESFSVVGQPLSGPSHGNAALNSNGSFTYQPDPGFAGTDVFIYRISDSRGAIKEATVTIRVDTDPIPWESGVVAGVSNTGWTEVALTQTYASMVVVATPDYDINEAPLVTRIRNASGSSFEMRVDRFDGTSAPSSDIAVHYVVFEEGIYSASEHGIKMEAVKYLSATTGSFSNWIADSQNFANSYVKPVVLGQVMTFNDARPSVFWSHGITPSAPPTSDTPVAGSINNNLPTTGSLNRGSVNDGSQPFFSGAKDVGLATTVTISSGALYTGKHVGQDPENNRNEELIGYLVFEAGQYLNGNKSLVADVGPPTVQGIGDAPPYRYDLGGFDATIAAVVSITGLMDNDGGWPVLYGAEPLTPAFLDIAIDEDQIFDMERMHGRERVAFFVSGSVPDNVAPVISLVGNNPQFIEAGFPYVEQGATAVDDVDGDLSSLITIDATAVNTLLPDTYTVTYTVSDAAGNPATPVTRTVTVQDTTAPVITLVGDATIVVEAGSLYEDPGATATDTLDGNLTSSINTDNPVNTLLPDTYTVTYTVSDAAGNPATPVTRTVTVQDTTAPVITLVGDATIIVEAGSLYEDQGATATDTLDGNLTSSINTDNPVNTLLPDTYTVTYTVSDAAGNPATPVTRTVTVQDTTAPVITLVGDATIVVEAGSLYEDQGATATDTLDGNLTASIDVNNPVNTLLPDTYTVTYTVSDAAGNPAIEVTRTVTVQDTTAPVITLVGDATIIVEAGSLYEDQGATATDTLDGNLTASINTDNPVNTLLPDTYTVTYTVSDAAGNPATPVTRTVTVQDTTAPVITLVGDATIIVEAGSLYEDQGATATDTLDGNLTASIDVDNPVNTLLPDTYTVTYTVSDTAGNPATPVTRTVTVQDTTAPVITLVGDATIIVEAGSLYEDQGATATDTLDGNLTASINTDNPVNTLLPDTYTVTYTVSDAAGNPATPVTRTVTVQDTTAPVITLVGDATIIVEAGSLYEDQGATATDTLDGNLTASINTDNPVNTLLPDTYTVTYTVSDAAGNPATPVTRTVTVQDTTAPVITLVGDATIIVEAGSLYEDQGATATDTLDGNLTASIDVDNPVNTLLPDTYTVTYTVSDAAGNPATPVTRTVTVQDTTAPVITLVGDATIIVEAGSLYEDQGATATDTLDGNLTASINTDNPVNTLLPDTYTVTYTVSDAAGNPATPVTRTVTVQDTTAPVITLVGDATIIVEAGSLYEDQGATATDTLDGNLTASIDVNNPVNTLLPDTYTVTYTVSDAAGNPAIEVTRTVTVQDTTAPVITLVGDATIVVEAGSLYEDQGATATDTLDGNLTASINTDNPVNTLLPDTYTVTYTVSDAAGNPAIEVTRTVTVQDTTAPVITLVGDATIIVEAGSLYEDPGATATDTLDGNLTASIDVDNPVNTLLPDTYTVTYTVSDAAGNPAIEVTRTVTVQDTTAPVITLVGDATIVVEAGSLYEDQGATATDTLDGNLTASIDVDNPVNTLLPDTYTVTYTVSDAAGNPAIEVTRTVTVQDTTAPVITLVGDATIVVEAGSLYEDQGATATDTLDGNLTSSINTDNPVNTLLPDTYTVTYTVSDAAANPAIEVTRTVTVQDTTAPVITLVGDATIVVEAGSLYEDQGATATDTLDGNLTASIDVDNPVNTLLPDTYTVTYTVSDAAGNPAIEVTRTVTVQDTTAPVITLVGDATIVVEAGSLYEDQGATATDTLDGNLTSSINTDNPVNTLLPDTYTVTYTVSDAAANPAIEVTRTVTVQDTTAPVITLVGDATIVVEAGSLYEDQGATATDTLDGNLTASINTDNPVNTLLPDTYTVTYNVSDAAGNPATPVTRTVTVQDTTAPVITLVGDATIVVEAGSLYEDQGATATDTLDGNLTASINTDNPVNTLLPDTYTVTYTVSDAAGNPATPVTRTVTVQDTTAPVITLVGDATIVVEAGSLYEDQGATATDTLDGNLTASINTDNPVNTLLPDTYTVTYTVSDAAGNPATPVTRTVTVQDTTAPVITLVGDATIVVEAGSLYEDPGATATDTLDGNLTSSINTDNPVNTLLPDTYTVTYTVSDAAGNPATPVTRTVTVQDTTAPVITLVGDATIIVEAGSLYEDQGATATDTLDGNLTSSINTDNPVNTLLPDTYTVTYTVSDAAGNPATPVTRTVTVQDTTAPVITLVGDATIIVEAGSLYEDPGATATDTLDGNLTSSIDVDNPVNTLLPDTYTVTYTVSDAAGNPATPVTRTVTVQDTTAPVITLVGDATIVVEAGSLYEDQGATATDTLDGNLTSSIDVDNPVNTLMPDTYTVTYTVSDAAGNPATPVTRTVTVQDTTSPVITLVGDATIIVEAGSLYEDQGATATDTLDGNLTASIDTDNPVNTLLPDTYTVTYTVSDAAGNPATPVTRTVTVQDTTAPVITLVGDATIVVEAGSLYEDQGATATDTLDGNLTASINTDNPVNTLMPDTYTVTYTVSDAAGNPATPVTRTVTVINDNPNTFPDSYSVDEDGSLTIAMETGLLANDIDPNNHELTVSTAPVTDVSNGSLLISADGGFVYTPADDFSGIDNFVYEATDSFGGAATANVTLVVSPINDPPNLIAAPTITGDAEEGSILVADPGQWDDAGDQNPGTLSYIYQWQRAEDISGSNLQDISGATALTYVVAQSDNDHYLRIKVIATDDGEGIPATQSTVGYSEFLPIKVCQQILPATGTRNDVLVIVNDNSRDSCVVGRYYASQRGLGRDSLVHITTPADYFIEWDEFRVMRDQIIAHLQQHTFTTPSSPVECEDGDPPYYCAASMAQIRDLSRIRYIVTTRGVPTRVKTDSSETIFASQTPSSVDNYLRHWLVNYYSADQKLSSAARAKSFRDGRGMRTVSPGDDLELIIGRIDGLSSSSAKSLVDRTIAAESNGVFGKLYGSRYGLQGGAAGWWDYAAQESVYGDNSTSWRYQLGLFGERRAECITYLDYNHLAPEGKAPGYCDAKMTSASPANDPVPGNPVSRQPVVDNALVYLGSLDGESGGQDNFDNILNWVRNDSCTVKLCADATDPAACRAASTDIHREINTACVGVAEGFIGYNFQSFPLSYLSTWPTGWKSRINIGSTMDLAFPEVRDDVGFGDTNSLWFRNTDQISNPLCYANSSDFSIPPTEPCRDELRIVMRQTINFAPQTIDTGNPQQYRIAFRYKAENIEQPTTLQTKLLIHEEGDNASTLVDYGYQTLALISPGDTDWMHVEATFQLDPVMHEQHALSFDEIRVEIATAQAFKGQIGFDAIQIEDLGAATDLTINSDFTEGHLQSSTGDLAAIYLSRLNGVGFWGSNSHHESNGRSFSLHPQESLIYFFRGLPLGDAVWFAESHNSGILYGDPTYSPLAVRFDYINDWDYANGLVTLTGSAVNGRDPAAVTTDYSIDYCSGSDFFDCDQLSSWQSTGVNGTGGSEDMTFGVWDSSAVPFGQYTLRLAVTSTNIVSAQTQTYYDYYPIVLYDPVADDDGDTLSNEDELTVYGTSPVDADIDQDGLTDDQEIALGTDAFVADTDADGLPDGWEFNYGTNPLTPDGDQDPDLDGLDNLAELGAGTDPLNADSDADGLDDFEEVITYLTNPLAADTDGDSLIDIDEINLHGTDATNPDTDVDAMPDGWEIVTGTNAVIADGMVDADGDSVVNIIEHLRDTMPLDPTSVPLLADIYVDAANVSGTEDGSAGFPYNTVPEALAVSAAGDRILIAPATYTEASYYITQPVQMVGTGAGVVLEGQNITLAYSRYGHYENLSFEAVHMVLIGNRNLQLVGCHIRLAGSTYVRFSAQVNYYNCIFENNGSFPAIRLNDIARLTLVNSTIAGHQTGIVAENGNTGEYLVVRNSILFNSVDLVNVAGGSGISYSLIGDGQFAGVNGNFADAPQFVDLSGKDFHLQPTSPAIDAGDPGVDYSVEPEPNGCRVNLGAYGNTSEATTSPAGSDSDSDGLYDVCETIQGTDPAHPDTDLDGLLDGAEVAAASNPLDIFSPHPEGMNLSSFPNFLMPSLGPYDHTDTLYMLVWSNIVDPGLVSASQFTVSGGNVLVTGALINNGDGTFSASSELTQLETPMALVNVMIEDSVGNSFSTVEEIAVVPLNSAPIIAQGEAVTVNMDEDGVPVPFTVILTADDTDGDSLEWNLETGALNGLAEVSGAGPTATITYEPDPDYFGSDSFNARVVDAIGAYDLIVVNVTINPVNDAPTAEAQAISVTEDQSELVFLTASDVDEDALLFSIDTPPAHGELGVVTQTAPAAAQVLYTPYPNYAGADNFTIEVNDNNGGVELVTVTVTVTAVDDLPLAVNDVAVTDEDVAVVTPDVLANDDLGDEPTSITTFTAVSAFGGTVTNNGDNTFTYTPAPGFNGEDTFTYTIEDVDTQPSTATVTVTVTAVDDLPLAVNDVAVTDEDVAVVTPDVLANDDLGDEPTSITTFTAVSAFGGTVTNNGDNTFTYTPAPDFNGEDTFTYTIEDVDTQPSTATVTVTVTAVDDLPLAVNDVAVTDEDMAVVTPDVLANDDLGDEPTSITTFTAVSAFGGTVTNNGDNTFTYTPAPDFNGEDTFTYTIEDVDTQPSTATVTVTVTAVDDLPLAVNDVAVTDEDMAVVTPDVLANDDLGDEPTSITTFTAVSAFGGTVTNNGDNTFTYTPAPDFNGEDTFTYTIEDVDTQPSTATVTVTVTAVDDLPLAVNDVAVTDEDVAVVTPDVLANDDLGDEPTSITTFTAVSAFGGTVTNNGDNTFTYTPAPGFNGEDTFTYTIEDVDTQPSTATVTVTVTAVDDLPLAVNDVAVTDEDVAVVTPDVLANDDLGDEPTSITTFTAVSAFGGTVTNNGDNTFTYTPAPDFNGEDTFTYTIEDVDTQPSTATVTVTVTAVDDLPLAVNDVAVTDEDMAVVTPDVLANDDLGDEPTSITTFTAVSAFGGTVTNNGDNTFTYTPAPDFNGEDTFTYTIEDVDTQPSTATVTVTVTAVDD